MRAPKVQVGIICHDPIDNREFEKCLTAMANHNAGVEFDLLLQLTEGKHAVNWNRLIDRADADFICVVEDDMTVMSDLWLLSMLKTMALFPEAALVMPILTKDGVNPWEGFEHLLGKTAPVPIIYTFFNMVRLEAGLRADENLTYFVDVDLTYQAQRKGFQTLCNGHFMTWHHEGPGSLSIAGDLKEIQVKDRAYLANKWKEGNR
jgi:hypothetical protein